MPPPVIEAGPLTLRPFGEDDIAWVCQVSQDPAIQANLPQVFAPYRREHAAFFVRQMTLAAWDTRSRAEFLVAEKAGFLIEGTLRRRLIHREERVDAWVGSLLRPGLA